MKFFKVRLSKENLDIELFFFLSIVIKNVFYDFYYYFTRLKCHIISKIFYNKIKSHKTNADVLIIELREDGHSELFASDVYYFQELGYENIDLICHPNIASENPLYLYDKNLPNIFAINQFHVHKLMKENYFKKYKYIFINSAIYYKIINTKIKEEKNLLDEFIDNKKTFNNDFKILSYSHSKFLSCKNDYNSNNVFLLYDYLTKNTNFKSLSPIYFTDKVNKIKNDKITLSVFGWVIKECRDYELLFDTFDKLLNNGINNFELNVVGTYDRSYCGDFSNKYGKKLYKKYKKYKNIHFTGRASNNEMYNICLKSDYVLFLLNPNSSYQMDYISKKASGTLGLTFGFNMIPIIEKTFADVYGFKDNAIIYEGNALYDAIIEAINKPQDEYLKLCKSLVDYKHKLLEESLNNLKSTLE